MSDCEHSSYWGSICDVRLAIAKLDREKQERIDKLVMEKLMSEVEQPKQETAMRFDTGKMRFSLVLSIMKVELARVFSMGAIKYADNNWFKGMSYSKCMDALERHYTKWTFGQAIDKETGCHHLAQVAWNALVLMVYEMTGKGTDDRLMPLKIDDNFYYLDGNQICKDLGLKGEELQEYIRKYGKKNG